jgi:hypothetical protein
MSNSEAQTILATRQKEDEEKKIVNDFNWTPIPCKGDY